MSKIVSTTCDDGSIKTIYMNHNEHIHRDDGPAVTIEHVDGTIDEMWYQNDILHRETGPAIIKYKGKLQKYYSNGKLNNKDGPAVIYNESSMRRSEWWENGKRILNPDLHVFKTTTPDRIEWYNKDNQLHCLTGPAVISLEGLDKYYLRGNHIEKFIYDRVVPQMTQGMSDVRLRELIIQVQYSRHLCKCGSIILPGEDCTVTVSYRSGKHFHSIGKCNMSPQGIVKMAPLFISGYDSHQ